MGSDYDSSIAESNKLRSSTGVALNWMSPIGPMSFVLSQNISKADTDKTETFRFNLGTTFKIDEINLQIFNNFIFIFYKLYIFKS